MMLTKKRKKMNLRRKKKKKIIMKTGRGKREGKLGSGLSLRMKQVSSYTICNELFLVHRSSSIQPAVLFFNRGEKEQELCQHDIE